MGETEGQRLKREVWRKSYRQIDISDILKRQQMARIYWQFSFSSTEGETLSLLAAGPWEHSLDKQGERLLPYMVMGFY